jgi:hypothetical protein
MTGLAVAAFAGRQASASLAYPSRRAMWDACAVAGGVLATVAVLVEFMWFAPSPLTHAYGAVSNALLLSVGVHAAIGALFALHAMLRGRGGFVSPRRNLDHALASSWHDYAALTGAAVLGLLQIAGASI